MPELSVLMGFVYDCEIVEWTTDRFIHYCWDAMQSEEDVVKSAVKELWTFLVVKDYSNLWLEAAFRALRVSKEELFEHLKEIVLSPEILKVQAEKGKVAGALIQTQKQPTLDHYFNSVEPYQPKECRFYKTETPLKPGKWLQPETLRTEQRINSRREPTAWVDVFATAFPNSFFGDCAAGAEREVALWKKSRSLKLPIYSSSEDVGMFRQRWIRSFNKALKGRFGDLEEKFHSPETAHQWIEDACHVAEQWKNKGISVPSVSDVEKLVEECVKSICQGEASESIWKFTEFILDPREIRPCLQGQLDPIFSRHSNIQ
eukprot:Gregarina_sp_Poly_1__6950@NODE_377_length_9088_cov_94_889924_g310_i0_p3_GENE_NODE_377_length_9088_cov_94_889924_g310_i0NODE_377_length_9088_cov_94_889924_g310_i0_p3_ORF_typecomplete_len316_score48_72_NODE_377_length_9088_cov_94_889924_g310_i025343481